MALNRHLLFVDFLVPISRLKRAECTPKKDSFRRIGADSVPILRRLLNLGACFQARLKIGGNRRQNRCRLRFAFWLGIDSD